MRSPSVVLRICAAVVLGLGLGSLGTAQNREKSVISARAGAVNAVDGRVMVTRAGISQLLTAQDDLTAGDLVTTGAASDIEVLLNPGSYLRVGENSAFELADNSLDNLRVQLLKGSAIVEGTGLANTELHITIATRQAHILIVRRGLYRINAGSDATELLVHKGRVQIDDDPRNVIKSGTEVVFRGSSVVARKLGKQQPDQFDDWSRARANTLAKANEKLSARALNPYLASFNDRSWDWWRTGGFWAFSPFEHCYTFMPFGYGWSSPYGYAYPRSGAGLDCGFCSGVADHRGIHIREPISGGLLGGSSGGGSSSGGSVGGSTGGSTGNIQSPNPPPSPMGQRESDSGSRAPSRPKDPNN